MATVDQKMLKTTKFPTEFNQKVDMRKVNVEVMKKWIAGKISEILEAEDDVVIELCFNLLEGSRFPNIKEIQISLTGFLDKDTAKFCKELWNLCLSAQSNPQGVPKELLEAKKQELMQEKIDAERAAADAQQRKDMEATRERDVNTIRQRERDDRRERGDGRRGGRGGRGFDRRGPRNSRSPPRRRNSPPRRDIDSYNPRGNLSFRDRETRPPPRRPSPPRSPSNSRSNSRSRSRTPPRRRSRAGDGPSRRHRRSPSYSISRSRSRSRSVTQQRHRRPDRGDVRGVRGKDTDPGKYGKHSVTASEKSRSRSPRHRASRRRRSRSVSHSPIKPEHSRRSRRHEGTSSSSRSQSPSRYHRARPSGRSDHRASPSHAATRDVHDLRADIRKDTKRDDRHDYPSKRQVERSVTETSLRNGRLSRSRSLNRSRSRSPPRPRKRHRSIERYAPAGKRRRNTSSVSSSHDNRRKRADSPRDERDRRTASHQTPRISDEDVSDVQMRGNASLESTSSATAKTETQLREALLKEKVKSMRRLSNTTKGKDTD